MKYLKKNNGICGNWDKRGNYFKPSHNQKGYWIKISSQILQSSAYETFWERLGKLGCELWDYICKNVVNYWRFVTVET